MIHVAPVTLEKALSLMVNLQKFSKSLRKTVFITKNTCEALLLQLTSQAEYLWWMHHLFFFMIVTEIQFLSYSPEQIAWDKVDQEKIKELVCKMYCPSLHGSIICPCSTRMSEDTCLQLGLVQFECRVV